MKVKVGDKIRLSKPMGAFTNIGEVCTIIAVDDDGVSFKFGNNLHMGYMSNNGIDKYFQLVAKTSVSRYDVESILSNSRVSVDTVFGKCTVVSVELPNGFIIVERSACVDPSKYDKEIGKEACMVRIKQKIQELEGYLLAQRLYCEK